MRGLILGFDGVLVDDQPAHVELLCRVLGEEGLEVTAGEAAHYLEADASPPELDRRILEGALRARDESVDPARLSRLVARKAAYYQMRLRLEGHRLIEGGRALIDQAVAAGWMLGMVTATPRDEVEAALEQLGLKHRIKTLVAGGDGVGGSLAAYLRAFQELNALPPLPARLLHPHEILSVDALPASLVAATEAGFSTVGVATRRPPGQLSMADLVLANVAEIDLLRLDGLQGVG